MDRKVRTPADALRDPRPGDVSDTAPQPPPKVRRNAKKPLGCSCPREVHDSLDCGVPLPVGKRKLPEWVCAELPSDAKRIEELEAQVRDLQAKLSLAGEALEAAACSCKTECAVIGHEGVLMRVSRDWFCPICATDPANTRVVKCARCAALTALAPAVAGKRLTYARLIG